MRHRVQPGLLGRCCPLMASRSTTLPSFLGFFEICFFFLCMAFFSGAGFRVIRRRRRERLPIWKLSSANGVNGRSLAPCSRVPFGPEPDTHTSEANPEPPGRTGQATMVAARPHSGWGGLASARSSSGCSLGGQQHRHRQPAIAPPPPPRLEGFERQPMTAVVGSPVLPNRPVLGPGGAAARFTARNYRIQLDGLAGDHT